MKVAGLLLAMALVASVPAEASVITYTDLNSWLAATGSSVALEDFTDATIVGGGPAGLNQVTGLIDGLAIRTSGFGGSISGGVFSDSVFYGLGWGGSFDAPQISFDLGTSAFAMDLSGIGGLRLMLGEAGSLIAPTGPGFLGVVSTTPITSVGFNSNSFTSGGQVSIDNIRFATVPEPSTLLLLSAGAVGIAVSRFMTRSRASRR